MKNKSDFTPPRPPDSMPIPQEADEGEPDFRVKGEVVADATLPDKEFQKRNAGEVLEIAKRDYPEAVQCIEEAVDGVDVPRGPTDSAAQAPIPTNPKDDA